MLQRHRDILYDYSKEYKKTRNNLKTIREHNALLNSLSNPGDDGYNLHSFKSSSTQDYLLTERSRIDDSHSLADIVIEYACLLIPGKHMKLEKR